MLCFPESLTQTLSAALPRLLAPGSNQDSAKRGSPARAGRWLPQSPGRLSDTPPSCGVGGLPDAGALPNPGGARQNQASSATEGRGAGVCSGPGPHLQSRGETCGQMTIETTSNSVTEGAANVEAFGVSKSPPKGHPPHLWEIPQSHGRARGTGPAPARTEGTGHPGPSHPHPDRKMPRRGTEFAQKRLNEVLTLTEPHCRSLQLAKVSKDNEETEIPRECEFPLRLILRTMISVLYEVHNEAAHGLGRAGPGRRAGRGTGVPGPGAGGAGRAGFTLHKRLFCFTSFLISLLFNDLS